MDEQQSAAQFVLLMDAMQTRGFEHYEISNFCKPGHYSKHNANYWKGVKYLGIGPSAHSFNGEARQWNVANNAKYLNALQEGKLNAETELLTEANRLNEYIMTSLRTMWGCDLEKITATWGEDMANNVKKNAEILIDKHLARLENNKLTITNKGKLFADSIASDLFF